MFTQNVAIFSALDVATGVADRNGATLDTSGFDEATAVVKLGTVGAGGTKSIKMQQGDAADMSDAADLAGSEVAINDGDANGIKFICVVRPRKRYVRVVTVQGGISIECAAVYLLSEPKVMPTTHESTTIGEELQSPAEGTP